VGNYSIKDLEVLSGIKAHTLRIWEQRFSIVEPRRTDTNIRFYNDDDLKKILNISLLNQNGYKISKIAEMNEDEISNEVSTISDKNFKYPDLVNSFVKCMICLDKDMFETLMHKCVSQYGFENTMLKIVFPFLNKVGLLWLTGSVSPSQEHFISHLIRKKIMVALDNQDQKTFEHSKTFLLFLPQGEYHEVGLLFASYYLKERNHSVIYLGQNLPLAHVKDAFIHKKIDYIVTIFTSASSDYTAEEYIEEMSIKFPDTQIIVSGYQVIGQDLQIPDNVQILYKIEDLDMFNN
jgi:MerR family transcriptional regulator, light-induced transcriptional regulator